MSVPVAPVRLVASPYVVDVAGDAAGGADGAPLRRALAARRIALVTDVARGISFALSTAEYERLCRGSDPEDAGGAFLRREGLLVTPQAARARHRYRSVEIEINRHCNYRCEFCPVHARPKPAHSMGRALFARCLDQVVEYGAPMVSLHHYSEPTLHREFTAFVGLAVARGLRVRVHTNATGLDEAGVEALAAAGRSVQLVVNLPSIDREAYERIVGARLYDRACRNLRALADAGVALSLSINAPTEGRASVLAQINAALGERIGAQVAWPTDDRAGLVQLGAYAPSVSHRGRLSGCTYALRQINIGYDGRVFLCCQDYDQRYVAGNVARQSLREILDGPAMSTLRGRVFGVDDAPDDFICRRCAWTSARSGLRIGGGAHVLVARLGDDVRLSDDVAAMLRGAGPDSEAERS
ncbi:MAG: radical SAM/SPASM domain-containing protein [Myxococcota bacterium]